MSNKIDLENIWERIGLGVKMLLPPLGCCQLADWVG